MAKAIGDQSQTVTTNGGVSSVTVAGEYPNRSRFIRISAVNNPTYRYLAADGSVNTRSSDGLSYELLLPQTGSGTFGDGAGDNFGSVAAVYGADTAASNIQGLAPSDYNKAISILTNKEEFKFKTLIVPGLDYNQHSSTLDTVISNTETRGDYLSVIDLVPYGNAVTSVKNEAESLDTSFAAAYYPWVQVRSVELGKNVWAPASTIIPGVYAKNDSIAAPWFAPA